MADKAPNEEEAGHSEAFFDQFLRRLDQTDHETTVSPSTSRSSMAAPSEYSSLATSNPWPMFTVSSPVNPDLQSALQGIYRSSVPSTYLSTNPLAEFPWLLEDQLIESHHRGDSKLASNLESNDSGLRYSTHYSLPATHGEQLSATQGSFLGSAGVENIDPSLSSQSLRWIAIKEEPASSHTSAGSPVRPGSVARKEIQGHGTSTGSYGSSPKLDAGPVPRFDRTISSEERSIPSPSLTQFGGSSQSPLSRSQNYWSAPASPRLSEAVPGASASISTSAGTSNTSLPSESTSNAGEEDEAEKKEISTAGSEDARGGKRKKPWASTAGGEGGAARETESKKSEPKSRLLCIILPSIGTQTCGSLSMSGSVHLGTSTLIQSVDYRQCEVLSQAKGPMIEWSPSPAGCIGMQNLNRSTSLLPADVLIRKNKPRKRGGAKRLREPRYAIKTRTDVDVLDDGFKWRKYGQKAVKNSPHPRNYYRCTTPLCPVRKRVERSNEDAGLVITTYEGTHSHQTPGFHRPAEGYFSDRATVGGGLFPNPGQSPLGPGSNLLPLPPGFDLASLQQATALRSIPGLQPNQNIPGSNQQQQQQMNGLSRGPFSYPGQENMFRTSPFLGLQDPAFGIVKHEPFHFTPQAPDFMSGNMASLPHLNVRQQFEQPGSSLARPGAGPSQPLDFSTPNHTSVHRSSSGPIPQISSPLFTGLNFPIFPSSSNTGPASSSSTPRESDPSNLMMCRGQTRHDAGVGGSGSRIGQSLETRINRCHPGQPNFYHVPSSETPLPGRLISGSHGLGSPLDPLTRTGQQRSIMSTMQSHVQQTRSSSGVSSSGEQSPESLTLPDAAGGEGLLQDMVRHGGPKVSKS
ncbi:uncharacterized protein [Physcomitrium patens]|uniref:uncharacterized protein isoform X1 n=1 Tax=Physcomitrium patens TaxID=3218 RepID=UPI00024AD44B